MFLETFLRAHSEPLLADVAAHGALLLRGFEVRSPRDFERALLSIGGLQGMDEVLMSEEGRTLVPGTRYVLYTNTRFKTGGTVEQPIFHHENYYVPDVPRFIAFACFRPPWLGGETGLLHGARLFADLPAGLRARLERRAVAVSDYRLTDVAARYGCSLDEVRDFCARLGLATTRRDGREYLEIHKPSVIEHPTSGERALLINLSGQLDRVGLAEHVAQAFAGDYAGPAWFAHRLHWRFPGVFRWLSLLTGLVARPRRSWPLLGARLAGLRRRPVRGPAGAGAPERLADLFEPGDVAVLARAMRRRYSSFTWRRGDVLLVDNLTVAHAGMPGFGPRDLKALICNCLAIPYAAGGAGLHVVRPDERRESLGARLARARDGRGAAPGDALHPDPVMRLP
jgi:alpha-ketoglutarate-dependent taurine dioxygenase